MKKLSYRPTHPVLRGINFLLSALYAAMFFVSLYYNNWGHAAMAFLLFVIFTAVLLAQGIVTHLSENIRVTKAVMDHLNSQGKILSNAEAVLFLFQLDKQSYQTRGKSFTNHLWMKKDNLPYSNYVTEILESYNQHTLPKMPPADLMMDEKQLIDEINLETIHSLVQDDAFNLLPENSVIPMKKTYA